MCGRFSLTASVAEICARFQAAEALEHWVPRYNAAPGQQILTVVSQEAGVRTFALMRWGLIPHWSKEPSIGNRMINARAESLSIKPSFKKPFKTQRCLIPADGFYEWKYDGSKKIPLRIVRADRRLFAFAALWDTWIEPGSGKSVRSFTIITTEANRGLQTVHDRMPAILLPEDEALWLDPSCSDAGRLSGLLKPYPEQEMEYYEVSPVVNSWQNDVPECIAPYGPIEGG